MKKHPNLTPSIHRHFKLGSKSGVESGFALIATISVMVLLVMIALAMLSLSTIELRSSQNGKAMAEAKANARMALMIAIGELQKELGPDKRISARADILDSDPSTEEVDDVDNPHYLGVWESWDTWLTDKKGSLTIQDTYKRGRDPSLFRRWLVSNRDAGDYDTALTGTLGTDAVLLVGPGSAGNDSDDHIRVERVPVQRGGSVGGNYAWWISDETQKARLDLKARADVATIEEAATVASHTGRMGVEAMSGMDGYDSSPNSIAKMITIGQARISAPAAVENFHALTAHSLGLFTDVRSGGFKRDLNLAFESSVVPEEMDEAALFGGRPFDAPIRPMTGEISNIVPQNPYIAPMSWRQMRENYRVYRTFSSGDNMHPLTWNGGAPGTQRFVMGSNADSYKWDTAGYTRMPVMLRQTWIIATKTETNLSSPGGLDYWVLAVPVVSLWNPYNVAMYVNSKEISYLGSMFYSISMAQRTYRGATFLGETRFPDEDNTGWGGQKPNNHITANQLGYRMVPTEKNDSVIKFEPGQVRIFSTDDALLPSGETHTQRRFFASPGYSPVEDNTGILRGLKNKVNPGTGTGELSLSLRLYDDSRQRDPLWAGGSRKSAVSFSFQEIDTATQGAYNENGSLATKKEWHPVSRLQFFLLDWLEQSELQSAWIVSDDPSSRAQWPPPGAPPSPVAIVSIVAKSPEQLVYNSSAGFAKDYRNRGWLHAPVTGQGCLVMNPTDLTRADSAYQMHFTPVNGDQEVAQWLQADGPNGFYGGGFTPASGQTHVSALDLPVTPIVNLGSFASVSVAPARSKVDQRNDSHSSPSVDASSFIGGSQYNLKHQAHAGAAFGAGIGNAYAHPMIEPTKIYTRNDLGTDPGWDGNNTTKMAVQDDYWDHLFLANEELWDSWFCSGIAPVVSQGQVTMPKKDVAEKFFSHEETQMSPHFQPYHRGKIAGEIADIVETTSAGSGKNGWDLIGSYLMNKGQFNVNSTSKEAWKALLMSLSERPIARNDGSGPSVIAPEENAVSLTRTSLAISDGAAAGPSDANAWNGIRRLTEPQVDKLAEEIVRQVKLRGPFLNMTDFINRRLSDDATGVTGALQAAIDWDEFNAGYNGSTSGSGESINGEYKGSAAMITSSGLPANYPNPEAAMGSRYAGIPGYVMQSDLLQGIGSSLTVRGDTFLIRAYGESLRADGTVAAEVWCEAVVQRQPEYVDPADAADKQMRIAGQLPDAGSPLQPLNEAFGRKFRITSFRWLNKDEV
jgi:hypothetical protein